MSGSQDQGHETAAGDLDGLFETARAGGRMDTDPDAPQMIDAQVQRSSDLDSVLPPKNNLSERIKLGEAQEVATKPTGTGMEGVFSSSGRIRAGGGDRAEPEGGSSMDDMFGGGGGRMRVGRTHAAEDLGSGLDDVFGASRTGTVNASPRRARQEPATSSMDDFLAPPKRR